MNSLRWSHAHVAGDSKEERGDRKKMLEEIMAEKCPNLMKTLST